MRDDDAIIKYENHSTVEGRISLDCLAQPGTVRWYFRSLRSEAFWTKVVFAFNVTLNTSGLYFCYGYNSIKKQYFLSEFIVRVLGKLLKLKFTRRTYFCWVIE